ncbi:MAG TPA: hypothetical protein VNG33_19655 [Polyangiaceae bacterium]|nr:hypothetical protein [Polyangiaceae bacterium]
MTAQYLPTACKSCGRAALAPIHLGVEPTCQRCGARARVVPGEAYQERDIALFEQLEMLVYGAELSAQDTQVVSILLSDVADRTKAPDLVVARLLRFLPGLAHLTPPLPEARPDLAHALGMLLPIVGTRFRHPSSQAPHA